MSGMTCLIRCVECGLQHDPSSIRIRMRSVFVPGGWREIRPVHLCVECIEQLTGEQVDEVVSAVLE